MAAHTESGQGVGADSLMELGRFAPATLHTLGARVGSQLGRRLYNLLITNVPGPQIPLYAAGVPVVAMYPVAPLAKGQALALSVTSYNGQVFFGLTADHDAMPDMEDFGALLDDAIEEFPGVAATRGAAQRPPTPAQQPGNSSPKPTARVRTPPPSPGPAQAPPKPRARAKPAPKPTPPRPRRIPTGSEATE
jgi:diacylglycerol O-acyltransferase